MGSYNHFGVVGVVGSDPAAPILENQAASGFHRASAVLNPLRGEGRGRWRSLWCEFRP